MINIIHSDPNQIKMDNKSYKNIIIYYIWYITIKNLSYVNINSINLVNLITDNVDGYIEESSGNKYFTLVFNDKNDKKNIQNYRIKFKS